VPIVPIEHPNEAASNQARRGIDQEEPKALRTYTPTQIVIAKSAGVYHWTPEGRRLFDFSSGVLVANLGHNPGGWIERVQELLGWSSAGRAGDYREALPLTGYNAITPLELETCDKLLKLMQGRPGGKRCEQVMWAASGSEAVQKALWAALARDRNRDIILATRFGFHGKKGLAGAVTGCETDKERDPRVRFIGFPMEECRDVNQRGGAFDPAAYVRELEALKKEHGRRLCALITEPYLGGGGSYHPPALYLQTLQRFCRDNDIVFILDEVQSNFGRTRELFAFETYGIEPDVVILGKGLANGAPGAAAVGRRDLFATLDYGEGSDTYSGNPLTCAAVLATLEAYERGWKALQANVRETSAIIEAGLVKLKGLPFVKHVRGEKDGMVWGVEMADHAGRSAADWANAFVLAAYRGVGNNGVHLLGQLAKKVVRIAPPLVITADEAHQAMMLLGHASSESVQA
jgi:4-aminobutyrate aminotransferase-like enzyme